MVSEPPPPPPAKAEMEMITAEEIEMGQYILPPLSPLAFSLYVSFLSSHCSCCFSPLPEPPPQSPPSLYCSAACSHSESTVDSPQLPLDVSPVLPSDVRAALRLLNSVSTSTATAFLPYRIGGLLTNHCRLMADPSFSTAIRRAATVMSGVRKSRGNCSDVDGTVLEEAALCAVMTNGVEVQDNIGRSLGFAVYDTRFSWINHSCSPNACYGFMICSPETASFQEDPGRPKMLPRIMNTEKGDGDVCRNAEHWEGSTRRYGPKVIVRSIKSIKRGEAITVSYIDLLQPKALRQSDLWSKYRFLCSCGRCAASAPDYVDSILEGVLPLEPEETTVGHQDTTYENEAARQMADRIEEVIDDFLSNDVNPETCCEKIENVLNHDIQINHSQQAKEAKSQSHFWLHPMHHVVLNAYITLASTYKIHSTDLVVIDSGTDRFQLKAFDMSRISTAYSLFLAGATHHLFTSEPSLVVPAANFWTNAGESLLALARDSWRGSPVSSLPSIPELKCTKCSSIHTLEAPNRHGDLNDNCTKLLRCITEISRDAWSFLAGGCPYLQKFRSPVDFSFKGTRISEWSSCDSDGNTEEPTGDERVRILQLGVHCLVYAALLGDLCYGHDSHLVTRIHTVLCA